MEEKEVEPVDSHIMSIACPGAELGFHHAYFLHPLFFGCIFYRILLTISLPAADIAQTWKGTYFLNTIFIQIIAA